MEQSESIKELAVALAAFQGEVTGAHRGSQGHHGAYTSLADAWAAAREPLTRHGLAVVQLPGVAPVGHVGVYTRITHTSGEWMGAEMHMPIPKGPNAAQMTGSAISYARRYAMLAALGLPCVDDDAQGQGQQAPKATAPNPQLEAARESLKGCSTADDVAAWVAAHTELPNALKIQLTGDYEAAQGRAKASA